MANFKTLQTFISIKNAIELLELFFNTKGKNKKLLTSILPQGWELSQFENDYQFVQRKVQMIDSDMFQTFTAFCNGRVKILAYFKDEQKEGFLVIRLNVGVDQYDQICLV